MSKHEAFTQKAQENEIKLAHEQALFAEKTAKVLSKQAIKLVNQGEVTAIANRPLSRRLHPNNWIGNNVFQDEDIHSMELATNAALKNEGIAIQLTSGDHDWMDGKSSDSISIASIDGERVDK